MRLPEAQRLRVSDFEVDRQSSPFGATPGFIDHAGAHIDTGHPSARADSLGDLERVVAEATPQIERAAAVPQPKAVEDDLLARDAGRAPRFEPVMRASNDGDSWRAENLKSVDVRLEVLRYEIVDGLMLSGCLEGSSRLEPSTNRVPTSDSVVHHLPNPPRFPSKL